MTALPDAPNTHIEGVDRTDHAHDASATANVQPHRSAAERFLSIRELRERMLSHLEPPALHTLVWQSRELFESAVPFLYATCRMGDYLKMRPGLGLCERMDVVSVSVKVSDVATYSCVSCAKNCD